MALNYHITIVENKGKEFKVLRPLGYCLILLLFITGIILIIKGFSAEKTFTIRPLGMALIALALGNYLQLEEKWFHKKYLTINDNAVHWRRSFLIDFGNISWKRIKAIHFSHKEIGFETRSHVNNFSFRNVEETQIAEIKEILQNKCSELNIDFLLK